MRGCVAWDKGRRVTALAWDEHLQVRREVGALGGASSNKGKGKGERKGPGGREGSQGIPWDPKWN